MRKLVSPIADGGFPWGGEDILTVFQDDFWDALQGLLAVYDGDTQGVIVQGCVVTATADFDITAGIVYMDGEFYRLPAQTNVPTGQHIVPGATVFTQRTFQDLGLKNFVEIKGAIVQASLPGGQFITINSISPRRNPDVREAIITAAYLAADVVLQTDIDLRQFIAQEAYINVTLANSWTEDSDFPLGYYKDTAGRVHWRGHLLTEFGTSAVFTSGGEIAATHAPPEDKSGAGSTFHEFIVSGNEGSKLSIRVIFVVSGTTGIADLQIDGADFTALAQTANDYIDLGGISYDTRDFA